jgi:hypothetical protein
MAGTYNRHKVAASFKERVQELDLLGRVGGDISSVLGEK